MRVGLIGVGRFGRRYLQTLTHLPELQLVSAASRNPATDTLLPAGCTRCEDWRELIARSDLDGVLVVTPPASHAAIVHAAVRRGIAVLVEKPLTLDVAEAEALLALPATAPVMVEHTHLFAPAYQALRERLAHAPVRRIDVDAGGPGPWRKDVGVLWDWGAHWVAVCLDLLASAPTRSTCRLLEQRDVQGGIGQRIDVDLGFGDIDAHLRLDNLLDAPSRRLRVHVTDGRTLVYDELQPHPLTEQIGDDAPVALPVPPGRPLAAALREFARACEAWRSGRSPRLRSDLAFGVEVVRVLDRCRAACVAGPG